MHRSLLAAGLVSGLSRARPPGEQLRPRRHQVALAQAGQHGRARPSTVRITFKRRVTSGNLSRDASGTKVHRDMGQLGSKHRTVRARPKRSLKAGRYRATAYWLNADGHVQIKSWSLRLR